MYISILSISIRVAGREYGIGIFSGTIAKQGITAQSILTVFRFLSEFLL